MDNVIKKTKSNEEKKAFLTNLPMESEWNSGETTGGTSVPAVKIPRKNGHRVHNGSSPKSGNLKGIVH